jgi:hypothetical protein
MLDNIIKKILKEATFGKSKGAYISTLQPGYREFETHINGPFTEYATNWDDPILDHDSLDGRMSVSKKTAKKKEKRAEKIANFIKNNPDSVAQNNEGGFLNGGPAQNTDAKPLKNFDPKKTVTKLGEWVSLDSKTLNEDLAVWFGTKKKPKGSKQPKGPWVNICRKVDGKHPPCGRSETDKGGYPKCRAAGVAGKMSDSEKKAACQQKRSAEKKDTQTGKGQKPIMTSYKKKKTNEDMKRILKLTENDISRIVNKVLKEETRSVISEQKRGKWGDYIKQDFRKEKNKKLIIRPLLTKEEFNQNLNDCIKKTGDKNSCLASTTKQSNDQWEELIYGYKGITSENQDRMVISKGSVESPGYMIEYNCDTGQVSYKLTNGSDWVSNTNDENQNRKDSNWLKRWCSNITWTSDVGQKRKLFRNPKIY